MTKKKPVPTDTPPPPRIGRPPKRPQDRIRTPAMQLGRVPIEEQEILRDAAKRDGMTFTAWAVAVLLRAAKRKK